jgi:hypothetical protein
MKTARFKNAIAKGDPEVLGVENAYEAARLLIGDMRDELPETVDYQSVRFTVERNSEGNWDLILHDLTDDQTVDLTDYMPDTWEFAQ